MSMWWSFTAACAVLAVATGGAFASHELTPMTRVEKYVGRDLLTEVRTDFDLVFGCYLNNPNGEVIQFSPEDLSNDKYQLEDPIILLGCRVTIKNIEPSDAGIWEIYYTTENDGVKKASQYYNVSVTSQDSASVNPNVDAVVVNAVPSSISVAEGSDVHVRLAKVTAQYDTCKLVGPATTNIERDQHFVDTCGFVVRNVSFADAAVTWAIEYGIDTKYKATILVAVSEKLKPVETELVWTRNMPLNVSIGPEDAVYCRIENPNGVIVSDGFGRCNIVLGRVRAEHAGVWKTQIGTVGRVLLDTHEFFVRVDTPTSAPKAQVNTSVVSEKPWVMLSCKVESEQEIKACKFRDPSGKVLLASQGVGEDRYSFHGAQIDLHSEVSSHECGLRITNPVVEDLGLWRCAMETQEDTYYGFLTVLRPWAMQDPDVTAAIVSEPTLTSELRRVTALEGDELTMRCSVQSAIRYCYFRASNGTVFNVSPGSSDWFEYAGAGLDAGECGIRFPALQVDDSGDWSCHVGFHDQFEPEQRTPIEVQVEGEMNAQQYQYGVGRMTVQGEVHNKSTLEYCRFVRIDGTGFTSSNVPSGYEDFSVLSMGLCKIIVHYANIIERHPWTVVAKVVGMDFELARTTPLSMDMPEENPEGTPEPEQTERPNHHGRSNFAAMWTFIMVLSLSLFFVGLLVGPRKNREWTYRRAAIVRSSFRSRTTKNGPHQQHQQPQQNTPMPA